VEGGGPDGGYQLIMSSYRSELGGITTGLAVIGTLIRSRKIKVRSVKLVCDNEAKIKACNRKSMQSVSHRTEGDHDLISTIHDLQERWCQDIDIQYEWAKGHTYDLNREPTKYERLNIVADELCEVVNTSGQAGAQIPHPPLGDDSSPFGR
jgi:hypothetical protein